jgi:hypothetical protein
VHQVGYLTEMNSICFGQILCPSSGVFHCTFGTHEFHPDSASKRSSKPARNLPVPNIQWKTTDDGQRRSPKHVDFYNNKFG